MIEKTSLEGLKRISLAEFKSAEKIPVIVLLDDIRSMHNVGAVFRTADAFRIEQIILCGITAKPPHREIRKVAIGATESVAWEYQEDILATAKALKEAGCVLLAIEQAEPKTALNDFSVDVSKKQVLIFGNEVNGVKNELIQLVDQVIEIPQSGTKHSLNISVSSGIVLWEFYRQFKGFEL